MRRPGQEGMTEQRVAEHQPDCGPEAARRQAMLVAPSRSDRMASPTPGCTPLLLILLRGGSLGAFRCNCDRKALVSVGDLNWV